MNYYILSCIVCLLSLSVINVYAFENISNSIVDAEVKTFPFSIPRGLVTDSDGRIIVADTFNHRIQIFDSNGTYLDSIVDADGTGGSFNLPSGVTTDSDGRIIVADTFNHRIQIFDSNGTYLDSTPPTS